MPRGEGGRRGAAGFTYVGLLALIVLVGLMLAAAGEVASTAAQREREAQLLWVGHEYRAAIGRYWGLRRAYPQALPDLLGTGPDAPVQVHYLRRLYPDPMTNAVDWVLVPAPGGGIMGVASSSKRAPLKTGNFDDADKGFEEATSYGDWKFTFESAARQRAWTPAAPAGASPAAPAAPPAAPPEAPPAGPRRTR